MRKKGEQTQEKLSKITQCQNSITYYSEEKF